jgi:hypothetical protein
MMTLSSKAKKKKEKERKEKSWISITEEREGESSLEDCY